MVRYGLALLVVAILGAAHGADDLFRRDAISLFGINAHKVLPAAGENVSLVAVGAEICQHFLHGLVGEFVVVLVPARVFGFGQPLPHFGLKLFGRDAGGGGGENLHEILHVELLHRGAVAVEQFQHGAERRDLREFRLLLDQRRDALEAIHHL